MPLVKLWEKKTKKMVMFKVTCSNFYTPPWLCCHRIASLRFDGRLLVFEGKLIDCLLSLFSVVMEEDGYVLKVGRVVHGIYHILIYLQILLF